MYWMPSLLRKLSFSSPLGWSASSHLTGCLDAAMLLTEAGEGLLLAFQALLPCCKGMLIPAFKLGDVSLLESMVMALRPVKPPRSGDVVVVVAVKELDADRLSDDVSDDALPLRSMVVAVLTEGRCLANVCRMISAASVAGMSLPQLTMTELHESPRELSC